ncbi:transmembrane sensor [Catalinimonas alkaloidigena]|uniref:FecR family protein n=1 Tax=Catalinimonas alkaloidigena TaxID=1075417 RepID=UPI0024059802|nr:FecR domain-containing protein [Catalinimonas alkaloidigena]MDF9799901.1 transmembrane sensor [Catalinimonas alkaloidigena]
MNLDDSLLDQLLSDDAFVDWIRHPSPDLDSYWQAWMGTDVKRQEIVEEARSILLSLSFHKASLSGTEKRVLQARIAASIGEDDVQPVSSSASHSPALLYMRYAAAIVVLTVFTYFLLSVFQDTYNTVTTAYGETKSIILPDSSEVTLNANSLLRYPRDWEKQEDREVWLEGEALFKVSKQEIINEDASAKKRKFVVHATQLNVEVLGTEFNVRNRDGQTEVTLREGKIKLLSAVETAEEVVMRPGEHARLLANQKIAISKVKVDEYTTWTEQRWSFRDTPLEEVAKSITEYYGLEVEITEASLKDRKFSGSPPKDDMSALLQMLSAIYQVPVRQEGNTIRMGH